MEGSWSSPAPRPASAGRVEREWGPIEVWVNNAMATAFCEALRTPPEDFRGATEVTYLRSELIHDQSRVHITMVQLSAFNTPQFDWARNCMGKRPQPVGKIFQPEVAARGICWAATHGHRERWVGFPAVAAILLAACETSPVGRRQLQLFPADELAQMGESAYAQLRKEEPASRYIGCVADAVTAAVGHL